MPPTLSYAYAVARDTPALSRVVPDLRGVGGAPVRLVRAEGCEDMVAAVSPVPSADFAEDALRNHLEDLDWLESVARAHHAVVEALAAGATVLPLRLATVYLDDEGVRAGLRTERQTFSDRLSQLASHVEWGVKIYVEPPEQQDAPAAEPGPDLSPGRAYLRRRGQQRHSREDVYQAAGRAAERVEAAAGALAAGRARHRVQRGQLAEAPGENVANDAYLVPLEHSDLFRAEVLRAAEGLTGVRVEVTGPWAPYSFAAPPEPAPPREEGP
ncbi:GvpL/GvpF family gas vesicle protein [Peterkaempfera griseoplana]|uniref:GvpL/GvpF family gas vesicle protein n=1 Tax=Peterkaempfera griseoplana TaxID=66896 RepID=UPI0006E1DD15|nr:GvpL/GvpF family gas vesicle protein [Peterkaempfera griseoplana]